MSTHVPFIPPADFHSRLDRPPVDRVLFANGEWLVPESERPANWRDRMQPREYSDARPKPEVVPRAASVRAPRRAEIAAKKPRVVRQVKAKPRRQSSGLAWNARNDVTLEMILDGWREGLSPVEMEAKFQCKRATINRRVTDARCDPAFVALENELRACACGRKKWHHRKQCSLCAARTFSAESTHRPDIAIEGILPLLREGLNLRRIAARYGCERRLIERRVKAALKHPEFGAVIRKMSTCENCGKSKYMHVPGVHCRRCAVKLGTVGQK